MFIISISMIQLISDIERTQNSWYDIITVTRYNTKYYKIIQNNTKYSLNNEK